MLGKGCRPGGKTTAEKASESDSNGYVCAADHKFFTPRKVFADKCPVCATVDLHEVYGYLCEVDPSVKPEGFQPGCGTVTLSPRHLSPVVCKQCGKHVKAVVLPQGKDLAGWGATSATRAQVLLHP